MTTTDPTPLAEQPSVRWCGRDDAHTAHQRVNRFGGTDYCTGVSEAAAARGHTPPGDPISTDAQPQMHNGLSMSLAEQIARGHYLTAHAKCACPDAIDAGRDMHAWVAHIATVTERAIAERDASQVARFVGHDGVSRFTVNELSDLRAGDFVIHPTVDGVAIARGWQQRFEAVTEQAVRDLVAQEIEAARTQADEFIQGDRRRRAKSRGHATFNAGMTRAARIARGATDD